MGLFPSCKDDVNEEFGTGNLLIFLIQITELVVSVANEARVAWAVKFFESYK